MELLPKIIAAVILAVVSCAAPSQAQEHSTLNGYAIRITYWGKQYVYTPMYGPELKGDTEFGLVPQAYTRPTSKDDDHVSLVRIAASFEGGAWQIKISVIRGGFQDKGEHAVATYSARVGESVRVREMAGLGVEPFEVTIVPVIPEAVAPPEVTNKTRSIGVVSLTPGMIPQPYRLLLQNLSHKRVAALEVNAYGDKERLYLMWPRGEWDRPLMEAGATFEMELQSAPRGQSAFGEHPPNRPDRFEVATVVFEDGTYEGEPFLAALINALMAGSKAQLEQVLALLREAFEATGDSNKDVVLNLKRGASGLSEEAEPAQIKELGARFRTLDDYQKPNLKTYATLGLHDVKASLLKDIDEFERGNAADSGLLRAWLSKTRDKYGKWLNALERR